MIWHGIVWLMATTEINHLTTIKMPRKSPVNHLNGYLFLTALAFASSVRDQQLCFSTPHCPPNRNYSLSTKTDINNTLLSGDGAHFFNLNLTSSLTPDWQVTIGFWNPTSSPALIPAHMVVPCDRP